MQPFLGLTQFLECLFEKCLVLVSLAGTQGCQAVQTHIDTNSGASFHGDYIRDLHLNGDKPPIRQFGDPCTRHLAVEAQVFGQIDPSEFRYPDTMISQLELIVRQVKAWFASFLAFELWVTSLALKERRKCFAKTRGTADLRRSS
jgi:hypothetical protein